MIGRLVVMAALLVAVVGCGGPAAGSRAGSPAEFAASPAVHLTIFGAASLKSALEQLETVYESGHPGTALTISTDSSAALETQIELGAPADVFLSADVTNPQKLVDNGLADGATQNFAGNVLAIVVPADNPARLVAPVDLAKAGVKVIAAGDDVPVTKYVRQVVDLLAKIPGYPAGFAAAYDANVVTREDNVKAVIAKVELGEGDAGIIYLTDARASSKVATIAIPTEANIVAVYSGVVVKGSAHVAAGHAFLDWMIGSEARRILAQLGFTAPTS